MKYESPKVGNKAVKSKKAPLVYLGEGTSVKSGTLLQRERQEGSVKIKLHCREISRLKTDR